MRNDAPIIAMAEWAARVNAETRAFMGVTVTELPEYTPPPDHKFRAAQREARAHLDGLMDDDAAAACVAADLARVDPWAAPSWQEAAADYHQKRGGRVSIIPDISGPSSTARATLKTAEYLVRQGDAEQLRQWLVRHSTQEREAILQHLERRKGKP